jgi:hypothetical protein
MSETPITPTPAVTPEVQDNSAIRDMRAKIDAEATARKSAEAEAADLKNKLTEIERSKLDELERVRLEKEDLAKTSAQTQSELEQARNELGQFQTLAEAEYNQLLATVPPEKRAAVEGIAGSGTWADRLSKARNAMSLIGAAPVQVGTPGMPPASTPTVTPGTPEPFKFDPANPFAGTYNK